MQSRPALLLTGPLLFLDNSECLDWVHETERITSVLCYFQSPFRKETLNGKLVQFSFRTLAPSKVAIIK